MWSLPDLGLCISEIPIGEASVKLESGKKLWHGNPRQTWKGRIGKFLPVSHRNSGKRNGQKGRWGRIWETRGELCRTWKKLRAGCICFNFIRILGVYPLDSCFCTHPSQSPLKWQSDISCTITLWWATVISHGIDRVQVGTDSKGHSKASRTAMGPLWWGNV